MTSDLHRGLLGLVSLDDFMPGKAVNPSPKRSPVPKLHAELRELILATRERVAQAVNSGLTLLYWQVGDRIRREVLKEKRAAYGEEMVQALAAQLAEEFGAGFSRRNLFNMVQFSEVFSDFKMVQALAAQLGWTHFTHIVRLDDPLKREFYAEMCLPRHFALNHPPTPLPQNAVAAPMIAPLRSVAKRAMLDDET